MSSAILLVQRIGGGYSFGGNRRGREAEAEDRASLVVHDPPIQESVTVPRPALWTGYEEYRGDFAAVYIYYPKIG